MKKQYAPEWEKDVPSTWRSKRRSTYRSARLHTYGMGGNWMWSLHAKQMRAHLYVQTLTLVCTMWWIIHTRLPLQLDEYLFKLCNIFAVQVYKYMCVNYDRMSSSMKMQTASNVKQKWQNQINFQLHWIWEWKLAYLEELNVLLIFCLNKSEFSFYFRIVKIGNVDWKFLSKK